MNYAKKAETVEAYGPVTRENMHEIAEKIHGKVIIDYKVHYPSARLWTDSVSPYNWQQIPIGYYVVRGAEGEWEAWSRDDFESAYYPVGE